MATRQNLVDLAKTKVAASGPPICGYVWGAKGVVLTQAVLDKLIKSYGKSKYDFYDDDGAHVLASKWMGKLVFDCSGFVYWCCKQLGVSIQSNSTKQLNYSCYTISKEELQPGDLCFCHTSKIPSDVSKDPAPNNGKYPKGTTTHVAIYIGNNRVIEAAGTRSGVVYGKLGPRFDAFGRIAALDGNSVTVPTTTDGTSSDTSGGGSSGTTTTSTYDNIKGWTKEYICLNIDRIVAEIAGPNTPKEVVANIKETIVANYQAFSRFYDIGEDDQEQKTVDTAEKPNEDAVKTALDTINKNLTNSKIVLPLKSTITSPSTISKDLALYFVKTENIKSKLSAITNFSKITLESGVQNKFHPVMIQLLDEVAKQVISSVTYFRSQQKVVIASGFIDLEDNDNTKDDKLEYSPHCSGLAADIYVDGRDTYTKVVPILTKLGIPNFHYNTEKQTIHIDISLKR